MNHLLLGVAVALTGLGLPSDVGAAASSERVIVHLDGARSEQVETLLQGAGSRVRRRFHRFPLLALEVTEEGRARLQRAGHRMEPDRLMAPLLADSGPIVGAPTEHAQGVDGRGWYVAVLDTGVDGNHPNFAGRVEAEACFSVQGNCPGGATDAFGPGAAAPCELDGCFHGTHVAGIAVGDHPIARGVAPAAGLIPVQVFSAVVDPQCDNPVCLLAFTSDILRGLEYVLELSATYRIAAVNLSLGADPRINEARCRLFNEAIALAIDALRDAGVATVAASGNNGFGIAISAPACIDTAVSVGSVDKDLRVSGFSNSAAFLDLLAPGEVITSSVPGGGLGILSGTSMATPHVAGAFALYRQVNPGASVAQGIAAFRANGLPIFDPLNDQTFPLLQVQFVPEPGSAATVAGVFISLFAMARSAYRHPCADGANA